jgi:hypothetical protein
MIASAQALAFWADRTPNREAIALSPSVGWWMLACAICVVALMITYREQWRRFWFRAEDPRTIGLFRIVFAFLLISNTNDIWEYFHFLFTDEGILPHHVAQQVFASDQFRGYGDGIGEGEPTGFFDLEAVLLYLQGHKQSLLWFWDSPTAFWIQLIAFELVTAAFMIGLWSRTTGFASWGLMISLYLRNRLFWEGTELVYFCFFFLLVLAHSGRAYSVDNWLRCRRLRARGRLSEPGGPGGGAGIAPSGDHPAGLEPIYRLIPSWPRKLMILQLAALYCYTGTVKTGSVWTRGDAFYYSWNLDHFYRIYPQHVSAVFGTNLFRLMTWVTHWWEILFPLVVVGLVARWAARERVPMRPAARWLARGLWVAIGLTALMVVVVAFPVHYFRPKGGPVVETVIQWVTIGWLVAMAGIGWGWWRLAHRPFDPSAAERLSRHVWLRPVLWPARLLNRIRGHTDPLDIDWFCRWFLGRRVWLVLGLVFHGHLAALMNIGMFPLIMMATYIAFLEGPEADFVVRRLRTAGRRILKRPGSPIRIPAQDRSLPHLRRDALALPGWVSWTGLAIVSLGVVLQVPRVSVESGVTGLGATTGAALASLGYWQKPDFLDFVLIAVTVGAAVTIVQTHGRAGRRRAFALLAALGIVVAALLLVDYWEFRSARPGRLVELALARVAGEPVERARGVDFVTLWFARAGLRLGLFGVAGLTVLSSRKIAAPQLSIVDPETGRARPPWAHGPVGRFVIGFGIIWHITAVAVWLSPDKDSLSAFRGPARRPFATWLVHTHTDQSWGMFAPNPPRVNVFHKVLVTDADGEIWDLRTDLYAPERKPIPWIWNDRMRKMNRRISGGESGGGAWYQKWFARWICRDWALTHGGEAPIQVELIKTYYKIPKPEQVAELGWYVPEELMEKTSSQSSLYVETCADAQHGQLSDQVRERHGLPPLEGEFKPWIKHRKRNWDRAHAEPTEARARPKKRRKPRSRD